MGVEVVVTTWAQEQFGDDAAEVIRRVVRAILAAHQSALAAQHASGLEKKFAYGSVWEAKYLNLVAELGDMPGAEIIKVPNTGYFLIKLHGKVLVPFRHASSLSIPISQAKIESVVLRDLAALSVPRPPRQPSLFDFADEAETDTRATPASQQGDSETSPILDENTTFIYIGFVANADSKAVLAAWWGIAQAQAEDGTLTWSPEELPLHIISPDEIPTHVPQPRSAGQIAAFDQGTAPALEVSARPRPVEDPVTDDERQDGPTFADDRE
ncbi:hypothetical protein BKA01_003229 [Pseudonocardia eucalypti]|nr:hypothetical protein [Pseudonocardia eucalypti]